MEISRVGIAYHVFRMYVGNLCGCGMNKMDGTILISNGLLQWWTYACLTSCWWVWFGRRCHALHTQLV